MLQARLDDLPAPEKRALQQASVVGAHDLVVVATPDAILVVRKDLAQDVRKVVESVKAAGRKDLL